MDNELVEIIAFLLSIVALFSIFALSAVKLYFKIRRCFPISVNCWFCNTWSRVPYDNQNCFDCPNCLQYNGFTEDGGYNKVIEAQHKWNKTPPTKSKKNSNGFCSSCNHNQQLKIIQLAKFTPLVEENYDEEIEHFKNQLEKAYELCKHCSQILKTTLLREKATFFGNHVYNIQKKGKNIYQKLLKKDNSSLYFLNGLRNVQGLLTIPVILVITTDILNREQFKWFPICLVSYLELYQDISSTLSSIFQGQLSALNISSNTIIFDNLQVLSTFGFLMQLPLLLMESTLMCIKINQFLCWSFLALASWTKTQEMLMNLFQLACACIIFYNSFYEFNTSFNTVMMKKLPQSRNNSYDIEDYSEEEDSISQYNESVFNKTKTENITANVSRRMKNFGNQEDPTLSCNIKSIPQDLHLSKSAFELNKPDPLFFHRSSSPKNKQELISPAKLNYIDENSWVAGGFWKCEDGTVIPINQSRTKSYSQSSGFCSQTNEKFNVFDSNKFNSLPNSIETSLSGDFDRMSIASKSPYSPSFTPPQSGMTSFSYVSPNNSLSPHNSLENTWSLNQNVNINKFTLPSMPIHVYNHKKPLNLFKFPQISSTSGINSLQSTYTNESFGMPVHVYNTKKPLNLFKFPQVSPNSRLNSMKSNYNSETFTVPSPL